jgi:hypothetical protein
MVFSQSLRERVAWGLSLVIRLGLGCVFLWSSLPKIRYPYDFLSAIYEYELVGPKLGMLVAMGLPWLELLVGLCLLGGIFVGGALLTTMGLAAVFVFVQASALYRGLEISCGCFSSSSSEVVSYATLTRSIVLLLACITAYLLAKALQNANDTTAECKDTEVFSSVVDENLLERRSP